MAFFVTELDLSVLANVFVGILAVVGKYSCSRTHMGYATFWRVCFHQLGLLQCHLFFFPISDEPLLGLLLGFWH